jgi:4-aminobutyrate aminotransferase
VTGARSHDPGETFDYIENVLFRYEVPATEVGAIFVEPVQGEGGYIMPPAEWLVRLRDLCHRHGILLVADEVQSGMGRTGRMWAIEHAGVQPDIVISAKGIASGLPLGAFMARADLMECWPAGAHGSTYGGSPVPCMAGIATLEAIKSEKLLANAAEQGTFLLSGLRELHQKYPGLITDVRGIGLMIGVEFRTTEEAKQVQRQAFERGLLVLECGESSIRISPPLVVSRSQASTGLQLLGEAMHTVAS